MTNVLVGAVLLVLVLALPLHAQPTIQQTLAGVSSGSRLRARAMDGHVVEWRAERRSPGLVALPEAPSNLSLVGVDSLWVRQSSTLEGTVIGLILGAVPAGVTIVLCDHRCSGKNVTRLAMAGMSTGAIIGAMKGSEHVNWQLLFSRPRE